MSILSFFFFFSFSSEWEKHRTFKSKHYSWELFKYQKFFSQKKLFSIDYESLKEYSHRFYIDFYRKVKLSMINPSLKGQSLQTSRQRWWGVANADGGYWYPLDIKKKSQTKNSWKKSGKYEYNLFFRKVNAIAIYQLCNWPQNCLLLYPKAHLTQGFNMDYVWYLSGD